MSDHQKIAIAKRFAKLHETPFSVWTPYKEFASENERYLAVYENIILGVYGDCYGLNAEYDENGDLITEATEFELEVDRFASKGDRGELFLFEITSELTGISKFIYDHGRYGDW